MEKKEKPQQEREKGVYKIRDKEKRGESTTPTTDKKHKNNQINLHGYFNFHHHHR